MALQELPVNHDLGHLKSSLAYVKNFRLAVDVGAHKGIWTRELVKHFEQVIAFEPVMENFKAIQAAFRFNFALGDKEDKVSMLPGTENTGQWHVGEGSEVQVFPLDKFELQEVDFLKIDVEGYELQVLKGAVQTITRWKPVILYEENGLCQRYGTTHEDIQAFLKNQGYVFIRKMNKDYLWSFA